MVTIGIIGAGRIGKVHAESISNYVKNATVKTIADPFMNEATRTGQREWVFLILQKITKKFCQTRRSIQYDLFFYRYTFSYFL